MLNENDYRMYGWPGTWHPYDWIPNVALTLSLNIMSKKVEAEFAPFCWGLQVFSTNHSGSLLIGPFRLEFTEWDRWMDAVDDHKKAGAG